MFEISISGHYKQLERLFNLRVQPIWSGCHTDRWEIIGLLFGLSLTVGLTDRLVGDSSVLFFTYVW